MTYVVIRNGPPKGSLQPLGVYTHLFGNPEACCICITEKRARDKAADLARDYVAEMVKDGTLDNCMEVNIIEMENVLHDGFELNHGCDEYCSQQYGHITDCDGENICNFTVSEVDCFDPPELEVQIKVNSGQFGDAIQPGDAAFYKKEGGSNV